jgi:hypothetical protein
MLSRRNLLAMAGAAAVTLGKLGDDTDADRAYKKLSIAIPGIARREYFPQQNASCCLVHIEQVHAPLEVSLTQALTIYKVHSHICSSLSYLQDTCGITGVYDEGLTAASLPPYRRLLALGRAFKEVYDNPTAEGMQRLRTLRLLDLQHTLEELKTQDEVPENIKNTDYLVKEIQFLQSGPSTSLVGHFAKIKPIILAQLGAVGRMAVDGKLEARISEDDRASRRRLQQTYGGAANDQQETEDHLLWLIAKQQEPLAVTVFGGGHCLRDNVIRWNAQHRDSFSLIELQPHGLQHFFDAYPDAKHPDHR